MNRLQNRAQRRANRRRGPSHAHLMFWADREEARAKSQGRPLPDAAVHPDDVGDDVFNGVMNAIGRRPPMVRFLACLLDAEAALERGDLRGAFASLKLGLTLLPRDDEGAAEFEEEAGDAGLDALQFGLEAVEEGKPVRALGLLRGYLDMRRAA